MSGCPKCRKMVFGSNAASSTLVRIALNILIIASSLILVSARRVPSTDAADIIEFSLEHGVHIKGKVPVDSKVQLKCPYEEPIWFKNGVKLGVEMRRMRMITFEKIKKPDTGTYACRSDLDRWSNLTLAVVPDRDMLPSFGANVQVLSQINGNFSEVNNKHDIEHPNQGHEKDAHNNFDPDDVGDDAHFDDGKTENIKGSPPTWKNESTLTHTLAKPSGSFIKLSCAPLGNPKPNITWTKNEKPIVRTIGKVAMKKWTIQMEDVISDDSGQYKCKVCNAYGCIEHTTKLFIQDRVNHKPIILHHPKNLTLAVGEDGKFNCSILSDLHHAVGWSFKHCPKAICPIGDNSTVIKTDPERSDILTLENVSYDDEGWYTCVAANSLGHTKASAYLHVVDELFDNAVPISSPIKNNSIWISVVAFLVGFSFLFGTILMVFISRKLKQEKLMKHRMETVHQWTKKVIIYKPSTDPSSPETMVMPIIKIEKQRTTLLQSSNTDPAPFNEYEFPLDSNWEIPRNHLTLGATLGEGAFGRVVMAEATGLAKNQGSCIVAVKMVKEGHTDADMASLVREMEVMKMIGKHINIINLLGCCSQDGPLYVIVEYAPHGNLKDFLKKNRPTSEFEAFTFDEKERRSLTQKDLISFAFQVARGMEYLASRRCIHRDLAARNVLVSDDYIIKIADFGLARDIQDTDYYRKNTNGRLPIKWMAPESLQDKFYDTQSDVWSYGVLLWEIMTYGEQPYPSVMSAEELYNYLMSGQRMEKPPRCSLNIYMLMRQCWNFDAHARPTFTEIVENLDKILTATANANEEYLDLGVPLLETPPSSDEESDTDTLRETTLLRYKS